MLRLAFQARIRMPVRRLPRAFSDPKGEGAPKNACQHDRDVVGELLMKPREGMNKTLEDIADALDEVSAAIIKGWGGDNTLKENWGFQHPALTRQDLAEMADILAEKIRKYNRNDA